MAPGQGRKDGLLIAREAGREHLEDGGCRARAIMALVLADDA
jgi:hypothetical protein